MQHCALLSLQPLEVFHDSVIAAERSMEMERGGVGAVEMTVTE